MDYKVLGKTGMRVSRFILGCGNFGGIGNLSGSGTSEEEAWKIMDRAFEDGINCFDTSNIYGGGASETYIGNWLRSRGPAVRDELVLSTKVRHPVAKGPNDYGLSRRHIIQQVDASLKKLGTDYLDMYLLHSPDPDTPLEETLSILDDLVRAGKIRYFGCSGFAAWQIMKALWISDRRNLNRFHWIQDSFSLIDRTLENEMLPFLTDQQLGFTPFSPLAGGILTGKYKPDAEIPDGSRVHAMPSIYAGMMQDETLHGVEALRVFAQERGQDMATLALAWLLAQPAVTAPIVGPRKLEHLAPIGPALDLQLSSEDLQKLNGFFSGANGIRRIRLEEKPKRQAAE